MATHHQEQEQEEEEGSSSGCHRSVSSSGGTKRPFEKLSANGYGDAGSMEEKHRKLTPSLASVVFEAVRMETTTKICSTLEPFLRQVIGEEVERALGRLIPTMHGSRLPPQLQEPHSSNLQLVFKNKLSLPLFTGAKVEGDQGLPIRVALQDATTGQILETGSESIAKLEVVVLDGGFANEDGWTAEQFEQHIVKERDGKRPLLTGDLNVTLKEGVGSLGELMFTDNSSWIRSRKFRLGVRVSHGYMEGIRIKECKTEAFIVKDHRGELYKKHNPPALTDEVWRLNKIGKDGAFHKRLQESGIKSVQDFLQSYERDKQKLRNVLGGGMSNKMWEVTVAHAKTCVLNDKLYVFNADSVHNVLVIFNCIHKFMGVTLSGHFKSVESLTENEKVHIDGLMKVAYANWHTVTECDSGFLAAEPAYKGMNMHYSANEGMRMIGCSSDLNEQSSRNGHGVAKAPVDSAIFHHLNYNTEVISRGDSQGQLINRNDQTLTTENNTENVLTSNRASFIGNDPSLLHHGTSQQIYQQNYVEWQYSPGTHINQCLIEEGIHGGRQVNDDMQQLLRSSYAPFLGSFRLCDDESYIPGGYIQPHTVAYGVRSSGRACIGWLKIKAALRWGIFIRKIAHEKAVRRAQLEELTYF